MKKNLIHIHTSFLGLMSIVGSLLILLSCSQQPDYPEPAMTEHDAVIDVTSLENEIPRFYTYRHNRKNVSFFVLKRDQNIISFLDWCTSCYRHNKGYRYHDGSVTCRFCKMKFSIYQIEKGIGGCYPVKLQGKLANNEYFIPLKVLQAAAAKF